MAAPYLEKLQALLAPVTDALVPGDEVTFRHFFSGAALYVGDRICITFTPAGLAMKLPEDARAELLAQGGTALRYFPKAPVKKEYVVLPEPHRAEALHHWAGRSIRYALSLPGEGRTMTGAKQTGAGNELCE
jgi:TfoX/Sxy family transcriptional regulator of competence genes